MFYWIRPLAEAVTEMVKQQRKRAAETDMSAAKCQKPTAVAAAFETLTSIYDQYVAYY